MTTEHQAGRPRKWSALPAVRWSKALALLALLAGGVGWYFDFAIALIASAVLVVVALFVMIGAFMTHAPEMSPREDDDSRGGY